MKNNGLDPSHTTQTQTSTEELRRKGLPPHIVWPMGIVALLVIGVGYSLWVVFASQSDGGVQVIDNYYEKAVEWDERVALQNQSDATGWHVTLTFEPAQRASEPPSLLLHFADRSSQNLEGLQGIVKATRPSSAAIVAEMNLEGASIAPGVYRLAFAGARAGLWDFEIDVMLDSLRFTKVIRKELVL